MRPKFLLLAGFFIFFILPEPVSGGEKSYGDLEGVVYLGNYDGDTVRFNMPGLHPLIGQNISIRVRGIDTPEIRGKCPAEKRMAKLAKDVVRRFMEKASKITLRQVGRGKYFRIVAYVEADGVDVSDALLKTGLAVPYHGGRKTGDWCGNLRR
jgi:micrococcal nuclease